MNRPKILIVEDQPDQLDQLVKLVQEEIPEAEVIGAEAVDEGKERILQARKSQQDLRVAILDLFLPKSKGQEDQPDFELCHLMGVCFKSALVIHYTAHLGSLEDHMLKAHQGRNAARGESVKKSYGGTRQVIELLKQEIYSRLVEREYLSLYGPAEALAGSATLPLRRRGRLSLTHRLAAFEHMVEKYWDYLDPELQSEIRKEAVD